ncbi:MAG: hypothetical protein Q6373_013660 [Candidatus Sigynarchaeota archaeon]
MSFGKTQWFALVILVLSGVGLGILLGTDFAGLYLYGYGAGYRYACLGCEYNSSFSVAAITIGAVLLGIQALLALNELLPNRLFRQDLTLLLLVLAYATIGVLVAGLANFGVEYSNYEWWPEGGFYTGVAAAAVNSVLALLLLKPWDTPSRK